MGNSACARMHFDVLGDFAFSFFKNYTVKCLDRTMTVRVTLNTYPLKNELTYEGTLFNSVGIWDTVQVPGRILMFWVILLLFFSKTIQ